MNDIKYKIGFKPPYSDLIYTGEDFYFLPRSIGDRIYGAKKAKISKIGNNRYLLYRGKRVNIVKLMLNKVVYKTERDLNGNI